MLSYQRGRVSLQQYQLLLCSLYKIYEALEEALDTNASHEAVAPIYFPQELSRLESIGKDLEYFYGRSWREKMTVPAATLRYAQRLREVNINNQSILVIHQWKQILILIHPYLSNLEITGFVNGCHDKACEALQSSSSLMPRFLRTLLGVFVVLAVGAVYAF
uniref:Heme oxygenase n=1 Tax=Cyprinus carpio TaxID=7962 RepID=A0A8C1KX11_CYPCA